MIRIKKNEGCRGKVLVVRLGGGFDLGQRISRYRLNLPSSCNQAVAVQPWNCGVASVKCSCRPQGALSLLTSLAEAT